MLFPDKTFIRISARQFYKNSVIAQMRGVAGAEGGSSIQPTKLIFMISDFAEKKLVNKSIVFFSESQIYSVDTTDYNDRISFTAEVTPQTGFSAAKLYDSLIKAMNT